MTNNLAREYDNRDKDTVIAALEAENSTLRDRLGKMALRQVDLMGEIQQLNDALELARQMFEAYQERTQGHVH